MNRLPKSLLAASASLIAVGLVVSWIHLRVPPQLTLLFPFGVILLGLAYITFVLRRENARFNEEQREKLEWAARRTTAVRKAPRRKEEPAGHPGAAHAHAH